MPEYDDELTRLFAGLRGYANLADVSQPAALRGEGERRTRRTRTSLGVALVALVVTAGLGAGVALRPNAEHPTPGGTGSPSASAGSAPAPSSAPSSAPTTSSTAPTTTGAQPPSGPCTAAELSDDHVSSEGAMGTAYYDLTVTNTGTRSCLLKLPTLWGKVSGRAVKLPQHVDPSAPGSVTFPAGRRAVLTVAIANGYGGYDPTSPACAHPADYRMVELDLGNGPRFVSHLDMDLRCGDVRVSGWDLLSRACTVADFGGAATLTTGPGSAAYTVTLTNHSGTTCATNQAPHLTDTASGNGLREFSDQSSVAELAPGHQAHFEIYPATGSCEPGGTYSHLVVVLDTGQLPVTGSITLACAHPGLSNWLSN